MNAKQIVYMSCIRFLKKHKIPSPCSMNLSAYYSDNGFLFRALGFDLKQFMQLMWPGSESGPQPTTHRAHVSETKFNHQKPWPYKRGLFWPPYAWPYTQHQFFTSLGIDIISVSILIFLNPEVSV